MIESRLHFIFLFTIAVRVRNALQMRTNVARCIVDGKIGKMQKTREKGRQYKKSMPVAKLARNCHLWTSTNVICSMWTRNGEIKLTGLLLATFNKLHILTY